MYEKLFSPGIIGNLTIRNRIVMEPMGHFLADIDGNATDKVIDFYAARAAGGVGLVITEVVRVNSEHGRADLGQLSLSCDERIPSFRKLAESIHSHGSHVFVQLHHPGRQGISALNGNEPMRSASAVECKSVHQPVRPMTIEEIHELVDEFADAAVRAKAAGIDGVELHCAHGYLLEQFISPYTNKRTDEYGGCLENRLRIVKQIIDATRKKAGHDYPLIVRISVDEFLMMCSGIDDGIKYEEGKEICRLLESYGVDAIDVSAGIYETMNVSWEPAGYKQGWKAYLAKGIKEIVNVPVFCSAVIRDPIYAEKLLSIGVCDFIGSARTFFCDPEWGNKSFEGREKEIRRCISCLTCMETLCAANDTMLPVKCSLNIEAGEEARGRNLKVNGNGRPVVIIGAGPAGLEAARVLALRNFNPVIFEKSPYIGGQLNYANKPPKKNKISWIMEYYNAIIRKYGIDVRLSCPATVEGIKEIQPYAVFVCSGSLPTMPRSIEGIDGKNVYTPVDILSGQVNFESLDIAVVGSGMTGIETADLLTEYGNHIKLFELVDTIGPGIFAQNLIDVMSRLSSTGCEMHPGHKLLKIDENSAEFEVVTTGEKKRYSFDKIVISLGTYPAPICDKILKAYPNLIKLGDANKPGRIRAAIESGYIAAFELE